jgi:DNA-binding CsgD family transcriptional regulator/tetratricopeptide (TPR) repeat protein
MRDPAHGDGEDRRPIVGRTREVETFRHAFSRMLTGVRQLLLIAGEPGIGKTRCAQALADVAEDQGALVLWGRCREGAGAPPYWPWVQILRAYIQASSLDEVRLNMGTAAKDIAALVPELLDAPQPLEGNFHALEEASIARFRTFDAISQFLQQAAQQVPITLILEDLHWSDTPSLSLLEFLSEQAQRGRLLIVATFRDSDPSRRTPLLNSLGELGRNSEAQRIRLSGLSQSALREVAEGLCKRSLPEAAIEMIYQRTDGNPLFAIELIKVLIDEGTSVGTIDSAIPARIPAGVHETISRRLSRLTDRCNELLFVASVHGRRFTASEVAASADADVQQVLAALEPAIQAGIIQWEAVSAECGQFTHALIRETIYEQLPAFDRLRLHRRVGDALVSRSTQYSEHELARIAHHYYQSATLGNFDPAVTYALQAAERSLRVCAYEDALLHYDHVIELLERNSRLHDERLARAYILKGCALRQLGQVQQSIQVLLEAVNRIRDMGSAGLLVDVLTFLSMSARHLERQHFIPLLDRTLTLLPEGDLVSRAKALATKAFAQRSLHDQSAIPLLVDEALDVACRSGDSAARCACFQLTLMALRGNPATLERRLLLGDDYIAVARSSGSADLIADACHWQALNYFESGGLDELETLLDHYDSLSAARSGLHQYQAGAHRVTLALLRGSWAGIEQRIEELLSVGMKTRRDDAEGVYGAQMFALNRDLGRLHTLAPQIKEMIASGARRMWEPGLMLICAEIGLLVEARAIFDRLIGHGSRGLSRDDMYVTTLVFCAQTCCALGNASAAALLYERLIPYSGHVVNHPTAVCFGAADLYLAQLACTAKWPDRAPAHFEQALRLNRAMRAWPSLARTQLHFGAFLLAQNSESERHAGQQRLREAEQLARRLEMTGLVAEAEAALRSGNDDDDKKYPDGLTGREVEVLRLLALGRTNKDVSMVLAISLNTVATHIRSILNKTHCANRTEAAAYAIRHGLQPGPSEATFIALR